MLGDFGLSVFILCYVGRLWFIGIYFVLCWETSVYRYLFCVMLGDFGLSVFISDPVSYGHVIRLLPYLLCHWYLILIIYCQPKQVPGF